MSFSATKIATASVVGALLLSTTAVSARKQRKSKARCEVVSIGYSKVENDKAIASASANAAAYICGGGEGDLSAEAIASTTAEAFALAVAHSSASCELEGDAEVFVQAGSKATAEANVWLAAYAEAFAGAGDCDKCDAFATSFGYIEQEVFLKAVAESDVSLQAVSTQDSTPKVLKVANYKADLQSAVVTAYAEALARAANFKNSDGCLAFVNTEGCIWTPDAEDPESCFSCEARSVSVGSISEIDAIAEASASASAWACGDTVSISELEQTAHALAEATAVALSFAFASCEVDGGFACAVSGTEIEQVAMAVAEAYADSWVGAFRCNETCTAQADAIVEAVGEVLATAATEAFAAVCTDNGSWTVASLAVDIAHAQLCAIAEASAFAITLPPSTCLAGGISYADATEDSCPPPASAPELIF